jgi:DNA (cytosine-5)-methyltransferase 1
MNVLDLFSGIGGFSLGLERAGMKTIAFCEIEEFPRKILRKHWPDVPIHKDVRTLHAKDIAGTVDLICGGFPCQDLSYAGKGAGFEGERSSLYKEMLRLVGECLPRYAIFENVTALLSGNGGAWFAKFLYDLAEVGYDAEWHSMPASYLGTVHRRDRVWIIAYPVGSNVESLDLQKSLRAYTEKPFGWKLTRAIDACLPADDYAVMRGTYDGVRETMDMLKAVGNSVVPQIPELIGRAIMEVERQSI